MGRSVDRLCTRLIDTRVNRRLGQQRNGKPSLCRTPSVSFLRTFARHAAIGKRSHTVSLHSCSSLVFYSRKPFLMHCSLSTKAKPFAGEDGLSTGHTPVASMCLLSLQGGWTLPGRSNRGGCRLRRQGKRTENGQDTKRLQEARNKHFLQPLLTGCRLAKLSALCGL